MVELTRRYKLILWSGWVITMLSLGLWSRIDQNTSRAEAYVFQALLGAGSGVLFTGTQPPLQASVKNVDDTELAVGMLVVFRLWRPS